MPTISAFQEVSNSDDVIDSRDVIRRIEELEEVLEEGELLDDEDMEELVILKKLAEQGEDASSDWKYGATLVNEDYFEEYAQDLVMDIGDLPRELPQYIRDNIDWAGVAEDVKMDYTSIDFDGETFWIR